MDFYERLNEAIKKTVDDEYLYFQFKYFDEVVKLAYLIVDNTPELILKKFSSYVNLNESVETVVEFFDSVNPMYSYMFLNILHERNTFRDAYDGKEGPAVKFYKLLDKGQKKEYDGQHMSERSEVVSDGFVHIDYSSTLCDVFTIAHEITHKFSQCRCQYRYQDSTIHHFLAETSTITMEFLLQDYLLDNTEYDNDEIGKNKSWRLINTYDVACNIIFENILLRLYKENNNCITEDILLNYRNSLDEDTELYKLFFDKKKLGARHLDTIVETGTLHFDKMQRYVIGTLLASYFHDKIQSDSCEIEKLCSLIGILGNSDITAEEDLVCLEKIGVPGVKNGEFRFDDADIYRLTSCYLKEVKDVIKPRGREETSKLMVKVGENQE